ncbi:MAG: undecaprenyl-diphosphate phosphatase [Pelagibacteraceae bacterium]
MIEIFILSIIQGITEFIPISSSSHLILISNFLEFNNQSLSVDISLHIGSFLAVIFFFKNDIFNFVKNKELFLKILISSLPVMVIGFFLVNFNLIDQLRSIKIIGLTTLIFGILLYFSDKFERKNIIEKDFNYKSAMIIGILQVLSLIPGVSRSGISITAARFLKFDRVDSAKISFLLSIPTLAAVSLFGIIDLVSNNNLNLSLYNILSIILSFIFSLITIKFFLNFLKKFSLKVFVIYRVFVGLMIILISYL